MIDSLTISDLADTPQYLEEAAKGIWLEWWKEEGHPIEDVHKELQASFDKTTIPTTLIAHDQHQFLGTVTLVKSDMSKRPQYTPWLASLWISPAHRGKGIGARLVNELEELACSSEITQLYLFAKLSLRSFYEQLGWQCIEEDVNGVNIFRKRLGQ